MDIISIVGILASICTGASLIPQLCKVVKEKQAENVSMVMLIVLFAGLGLWIWYGIMKDDWIIIISNGFSFVINILLAGFSIRYKRKENS